MLRPCVCCEQPMADTYEVQIRGGVAHQDCAQRLGLSEFKVYEIGDERHTFTVWSQNPERALVDHLVVNGDHDEIQVEKPKRYCIVQGISKWYADVDVRVVIRSA